MVSNKEKESWTNLTNQRVITIVYFMGWKTDIWGQGAIERQKYWKNKQVDSAPKLLRIFGAQILFYQP